jgi:hypothetical protein
MSAQKAAAPASAAMKQLRHISSTPQANFMSLAVRLERPCPNGRADRCLAAGAVAGDTAAAHQLSFFSLRIVHHFDRFDSDHSALHHFLETAQERFNLRLCVHDLDDDGQIGREI